MTKQFFNAVLFLIALISGSTNLIAQSSATSVTTTVNIILAEVISIDNGSIANDGVVNFNYFTASDYNSNKNLTIENSLVVTSSNNFDVKVKAEGENFISEAGTIPVGVLQVKAVSGGSMIGTLNDITLSTTEQILVGNANPGAQRTLNIDYSIPANKARTELLGKAPGTYTQRVKFTATAL
ncbi:peptidoglycan-binding protein LysM [Flavobacterium sp. PL12]|uniref:peptidoglycan-binding protein LysM n=1 Tax=Flavobacterium sp. PL12 TaxID=3071718 RepID=UPI00319E3653